MRELYTQYTDLLKDKSYILATIFGSIYLAVSLIVNVLASQYATVRASNYVTDIILSNTPPYDVNVFFVFGAILMVAFIIFLCLEQPKRIPFALKSIGLFVMVRSIFITLTHIGPYPNIIIIDGFTLRYAQELLGVHMVNALFTGNDLFFSGHTGLPFLMAFICWENKWLRYAFFFLSGTFAVIVLLGHLHYSIDVFAAFFITYSIFIISTKIFHKDYSRITT